MTIGQRTTASALGVALVTAAGLPASAQSWNLCSGYSETTTLSFVTPLQPPATPGVFPSLNVTLPGGPKTTGARTR